MAKNSIRDYSATASQNTDIDSIDIDENCPASNLNNSQRALMAHLKNVSTGAVALETPAVDQLNFGDNAKAIFGAGNDLQIFHNASASYITDQGAGNLVLGGDAAILLQNSAHSANMLDAYNGGRVGLYHNGTLKAATTSTGVDVTGTVTADGLAVDGNASITASLPTFTITGQGRANGFEIAGTSGNTKLTEKSNNGIEFGTNNTNRMTITSGGLVGIGNSSPSHLLDATVSSGSATARFGTTYNIGDNDGTVIISNGGSGDAMLRFDYEGSTDRARIGVTASGRELKFFTAGNNERMRIDSNGRVSVGLTGDIGPAIMQLDGGSGCALGIRAGSGTSGYFNQVLFANNLNQALIGSIQRVNDASIQYNTTSDARLKENIADMTGAIARVKQLAPKRYSWVNEDLDAADQDGFLAHEVQPVVPIATSGTQDEVDGDGNPVYMQMDYSKLVPLLTGALQEAIAKIETLETEMTALKARVTALEA